VYKNDADAFLGAVARTPELWRSVNFRSVAIWINDAWQNLVASVHLDPRPPEKVPVAEDLPMLQHLIVLQEIFPIQDLPRLIQQVRLRGRVSLLGKTVHFLATDGYTHRFGKPYSNSYSRCGLSLDEYIRGNFTQGHALLVSGDSGAELLREFPDGQNGVDVALRRAGWQSLNEVVLRGLEEVRAAPISSSARVTFVAPLEVTLLEGDCALRAGELRYGVLARSKDAGRRATLTITGEDVRGGRIGRSIPLAAKGWAKQNTGFRHLGKLRLANAEKLQLTLQVAGYEVAAVTLSDQGDKPDTPPLLMLAHDALFSPKRSFRDVLLTPTTSEGRPFERAVAKLFSYCGFVSDQPGDVPEEQNGPDVLVEVPERNLILAIETTVKHLMNDDGKMNRLTKRSADIRLAVKHLNVDVAAVMVVPWPRETLVPVEMAEAEKNSVRVLGNEDLEQLLAMALAHRSLRSIAHFIIPEAPKPRRRGGLTLLEDRNPLAD
jgi:hypothetical protein